MIQILLRCDLKGVQRSFYGRFIPRSPVGQDVRSVDMFIPPSGHDTAVDGLTSGTDIDDIRIKSLHGNGEEIGIDRLTQFRICASLYIVDIEMDDIAQFCRRIFLEAALIRICWIGVKVRIDRITVFFIDDTITIDIRNPDDIHRSIVRAAAKVRIPVEGKRKVSRLRRRLRRRSTQCTVVLLVDEGDLDVRSV